MDPAWLQWAKRLQAIAQNGLTYAENPFDVERYQAVRRLAAEIMAEASTMTVDAVLDMLSEDRGYATPKVDVRGVVFRDRKILLVKDRLGDCWTLPGGWADVGQTARENVEREVEEESGFRTRAVKLLAVHDRRRHLKMRPMSLDIYKLFFLCELLGGEPRTSHEVEEVRFCARDEIDTMNIGKVTGAQIHRMFEHAEHPDWPTDFD